MQLPLAAPICPVGREAQAAVRKTAEIRAIRIRDSRWSSNKNVMNTACKVEYETPDHQQVAEEFQDLPEGTYSALGYHVTKEAGMLLFRRLTAYGTALVALTDLDGNPLFCANPESFGKIWESGEWVSE